MRRAVVARLVAFAAFIAFAAFGVACGRSDVPDAPLAFKRDDVVVSTLSLRELARDAEPETVVSDDHYYGRRKRFRALPLSRVLELGFGQDAAALRRASFTLYARDGYAVPIDGERLLEGGAYIAYDDVDVPGFAPIGPQRVSPAPAYVVWTRPGQQDLHTHPRPWQLAAIAISTFDAARSRIVPRGEPEDGPAMRGLSLFREHCVRCHAVNREGGFVGPELNVPQSIVEYRPEAQIRAYVRNPLTFRYGAMPPHPGLSEADLDALIAYFSAMSRRKEDPEATLRR